MGASSLQNGWQYDSLNARLNFYYRGTRAGHIDANGVRITGTLMVDGATTQTGALTVAGLLTASATVQVTGNVKLGATSSFGTTQPVSALVMKAGTAPAGAATTTGAIFTDGVTVKKIIADGTASDVQT